MSGRGILRGASAMKNGRVGDVGQGISPPPPTTPHVSTSSQVPCFYQLDDLTLEGIKCSLAPLEGFFYEPLSGRFARITVKRRLSLRASTAAGQNSSHVYNVIIEDKKGRKVSLVAQEANIGWRLMAMVGRIYKFHTITICSDRSPSDVARTELLLKSLLEAAVECELTDVRSFELLFARNCTFSIDCLAAWVDQISPFVRHLQFRGWIFGENDDEAPEEQLRAIQTALAHCDQLRSFDLRGQRKEVDDVTEAVWNIGWLLDVLSDEICARPKLNALTVHWDRDTAHRPLSLKPRTKHQLTLDSLSLLLWLEPEKLPKVKAFLGKISSFHLYYRLMAGQIGAEVVGVTLWLRIGSPAESALAMVFSSLKSSPNSPAHITVHLQFTTAEAGEEMKWWPETMNGWLALAGRHQVEITIICPRVFSLPAEEQWADIKDAIETENILGLKPLPEHNTQQMVFTFFNSGAKVELLLEGDD